MTDLSRLLGMPWEEAKTVLENASIPYETEITRPPRVYFKIDETRLHVVRAKNLDGKACLVLAARAVRAECEKGGE